MFILIPDFIYDGDLVNVNFKSILKKSLELDCVRDNFLSLLYNLNNPFQCCTN